MLTSTARHKIVVAGPGTGKTYLFKQVLQGKTKPLTLSFINTLVDDLMVDLCGLSEVRTLHSYAHEALKVTTGKPNRIFGKLSRIIRKDAAIRLGEDIDFDEIFYTRDDENPHLEFYRQHRRYYDHYGYHDIVYALVKYWEGKPEKVLQYDQVLVDEFQDFNKLEVSLIELLAQKNPVLLAGDDDQALYAFKQASADYIRERHHVSNTSYASFELPHCSRCTRVIVDATNDIVHAATAGGRLPGRIPKQYLYFDEEEKDQESADNPTIVYAKEYERAIPYFIGQQIQNIAKSARNKFGVLIISPYHSKANAIVAGLRKKGFENVEATQTPDEPTPMLDGLKLLLDDDESNLGWRLVCEALFDDERLSELVRAVKIEDGKRFLDAVDTETKAQVQALLKIAAKIKDEAMLTPAEIDQLCEYTDVAPYDLANEKLQRKIPKQVGRKLVGRKLPIRVTTTEGSKGLAEQYVFITHCDDRYLIKAEDKTNISDNDICKFLVALTRARRRVILISTQPEDPTFVKWIRGARIQRLKSSFEK